MVSSKFIGEVKPKVIPYVFLIILGVLPIVHLRVSVLFFIPLLVSGEYKFIALHLVSYFSVGLICGLSYRSIRKHFFKSSIFLFITGVITVMFHLVGFLSIAYVILLLPAFPLGNLLSVAVEKIEKRMTERHGG